MSDMTNSFCEFCKKPIGPRDQFCSGCGQSTKRAQDNLTLPSSRIGLAPVKQSMPWEARIEETMAKLSEQSENKKVSIKKFFVGARCNPTEQIHLDTDIDAKLMDISADEPYQALEMVLASKHIKQNYLYSQLTEKINFDFKKYDSAFNADAGEIPAVEDGHMTRYKLITLYGGFASAIRLAATAAVFHKRNSPMVLPDTYYKIGQTAEEFNGRLPHEAAENIHTQDFQPLVDTLLEHTVERSLSMAYNFRFSMYMAVIAHEIGHIASGHTQGRAQNFDVSKNQERTADEFAASILSTCPYREYHFLGQIFVMALIAWTEYVAGIPQSVTHPLGRERFVNTCFNNSQALKEAEQYFGFDRVTLFKLLPPENHRVSGTVGT
jgi:hypothetical protein